MKKPVAFIIEDDHDMATLFSFVLELAGYKTVIIRSEETAYLKLAASIPDLILLDLRLERKLSGADILNYIRQDDRIARVRVIVATAYPEVADSIREKADFVLLKPISIQQLRTIVSRLRPLSFGTRPLAFNDPLTDLTSRALFVDRLEHSLLRAIRHQEFIFALLFLDVDDFEEKCENNKIPRDSLLVSVARRLEACLRRNDTVSRFDGNTFAIILEGLQQDSDALIVADRIQDRLNQPHYLVEGEVSVSASIGISWSTSGYTSIDAMVGDAKTAQDRAREKGGAQAEIIRRTVPEN